MTAVKSIGGCRLVVRAERGTENSVVAILQRYLTRDGKGNFGGETSFLYGCSNNNQRIECWWGMLRKHCCQFWMDYCCSTKTRWFL
ncbi:hypothetical protein HOLleu_04162 [Holothuria leucospilota]|uniref:Uncharacterized protein n=1 Tax=Holothuria leucospilota TaxID=206669 RepID=A0A9Q1HM85_HOLLE|nr:hypothetical protein HOLleu_04162 [Holothuria leucospilota]